MAFREDIRAYADDCWTVPCKDGLVWVYYSKIDTTTAIKKHNKATKKDWAAAFLLYADGAAGKVEGLYLIPSADVARVKAGKNLDAASHANRKMIASWYDGASKNKSNAEVLAQKPAYHGLNDCAHFVSECLLAAHINVKSRGAGDLLRKLRNLKDTKTLALVVKVAAAERIINSGVMKVGDVVIHTSTKGVHHHSAVFMGIANGSAKIAEHTSANHPRHPTEHGNFMADDLVTLIHFGRDDPPINPASSMRGWWKVLCGKKTYYYHFEKDGRVGWTKNKRVRKPVSQLTGKGYWFQEPRRVVICWTRTGTFEVLLAARGQAVTHIEGKMNGLTKIVADKIE